ncbi:MAG: CIA30 family protein [Cyanobacteria bacterium SBLK]|nr:CIA30 family protein [Cyanobacteria bacterium SBLK]
MSQRESWDLGRFVQTIAYFDGIPFLDCFPWLRNKLLNMDSPPISPLIGDRVSPILVIALRENFAKPLVDRLLAENYPVRVWVEDLPRAKSLYREQEIFLSDRVTPELYANLGAIVCCGDVGERNRIGEEELRSLFASVMRSATDNSKILFDFSQPSEDLRGSWGAVDDVVMGGVSESGIYLVSTPLNDRTNGFAVFSGTVSTANSGGFASVRHRNFQPPLDLSPYDGIQLTVKGDGKRYKFIARCEGNWDGTSYCYSFDTVANEWISPRIPFSQLIPVFRAKTLTDAGAFDSSRTYSLQLMLSKFEYDRALNPTFTPGSFSLQVKEIAVYGGKNLPHLIWMGSEIPQNSSLPMTRVDPPRVVDDEDAIAQHCIKIIAKLKE